MVSSPSGASAAPHVQRAPAAREPADRVAQLPGERSAAPQAHLGRGGERAVEGPPSPELLRPLRAARLLNDHRRGPCGRTPPATVTLRQARPRYEIAPVAGI